MSNGAVWVRIPHLDAMNGRPDQPYALYLSKKGETTLTPDKAKLLLTEPLYVIQNGQKEYIEVSSVSATNGVVLYNVFYIVPDAPQPFGPELWMFDTNTNKNTKITDYRVASGYHFSYGASDGYLVYDKQMPNASAGLDHAIVVLNLNTGQKVPVSPKIESNGTVKFTINGRDTSVQLTSVG